jgi:hypothetical protein
MRTGELGAQLCAAEAVDRLAIQVLGSLRSFEDGTRARLDPQPEVGSPG